MGVSQHVAAMVIAALPVSRAPGPGGSLIMVEESHTLPVVHVLVAARTGSASDPPGKEGLANLAVELGRRSAAGKSRQQLDNALDGLGATLDANVDPDSVHFEGHVLARNLDAFLRILADIILRPDFDRAELERTRKEIAAQLDEMRNDDQTLCARYFDRSVFADHPYGRAPGGTADSLERITRQDISEYFRATFGGANLIFAAAGDVTAAAFTRQVLKNFGAVPAAVAPPHPPLMAPAPASGQQIQIVDKPDRQQAQIMFGHAGPAATDPDFLPLGVGMAAFGGHGMKSTLMDEVRTKRGLAYGAYMDIVPRRGPGLIRGWVFTGSGRIVKTLSLVSELYRKFGKAGVPAARVEFFKNFLAGSFASEMDSPDHRLAARVGAEIDGLPPDFVDTYVQRLGAVTPGDVNRAIKKHITADNLTVTIVATGRSALKALAAAHLANGKIAVVPYDSY